MMFRCAGCWNVARGFRVWWRMIRTSRRWGSIGVARREELADFIFIALGTGVGAGIFVNGRLHRGAQWSAGEIGYLGVSGKKRTPMKVRELGQLEQAIGGGGIEEEWRRVLTRDRKPNRRWPS